MFWEGPGALPGHIAKHEAFLQSSKDINKINMADGLIIDSCRFEHPNGGNYRNQSSGRFPAGNADQRKFQDALGELLPTPPPGMHFSVRMLSWAAL
jgi:hypothetical protein